MFEEKVKKLKEVLDKENEISNKISEENLKYKKTIENFTKELSSLKEKEKEIKSEIEPLALSMFKESGSKKFFGSIGIREKKIISYDEDKALNWAKEKDMFITLDKKAFEKAAENLKLDFVEIKKEPTVSYPAEIILN